MQDVRLGSEHQEASGAVEPSLPGATALRGVGIRRSALIETEKGQYRGTRKWAEAIHAVCPHVEGMWWVSRQDDRAQAIILFGDRVSSADLTWSEDTRAILGDAILYSELLAWAERIGVNVVGAR